MATIRFKAIDEVLNREPVSVEMPSKKTSDYFGDKVFGKLQMEEYLSKEAYKNVIDSINQGTRIDRKIANQVAIGMKAWAIEQGATHYTHWFQPLTDGTAEKHDAFLEYGDNGNMIESFSGKLLAQ